MLNTINNHYGAYDDDPMRVKLVIVAHSAAITFFLAEPVRHAVGEGVDRSRHLQAPRGPREVRPRGYLCQITYKRLNVDIGKTRTDPFLRFVPSGLATVAELQGKGFAYLKVG
jgi:hypothetical protein